MGDDVRAAFDLIRQREYVPALNGVTGTYRFDVEGAGIWRVAVDDGALTVSDGDGDADCLIRCGETDFLRIARGEQNLLIAAMQGRVTLEGNLVLAQKFFRLTRAQRPAA